MLNIFQLPFQLVWPEWNISGRLLDTLHNLKRLSVPIHIFRKLLSHRKFSSSLSSVAGSDISEPLSHPSITYPVGVVCKKYPERFPKGYRKSAFHVVQPSWGEVFRRVCQNHSSCHSGILGPSLTFLTGSSQKVTFNSSYSSLVEVGHFGASVRRYGHGMATKQFIYSVTIPTMISIGF